MFKDAPTTEIYTLSLHDALPICTHERPVSRRVIAHEHATHAPPFGLLPRLPHPLHYPERLQRERLAQDLPHDLVDRKSTRLNSSHANITYAVFCLKIIIHSPLPR